MLATNTHLRIGVFDSGLGGLSVFRLLPAALPFAQFIYVGDNARAPYGCRSTAEILRFSEEITGLLIERLACAAVVIACNTATAAAAEVLRKHYLDVPIIGMEPAVKPAAKATRSGIVGLLATAGTIESERYETLLNEYGQDIKVVEDPCRGLVEAIENGERGLAMQQRLKRIVEPMLEAGADTLILGCTHFPLIANELKAVAGPEVTLIDPAPAVVRQTRLRVSEEVDAMSFLPGQAPPHLLLTSGSVEAFRQNTTRLIPHLAAQAEFGSLSEAEEIFKPTQLRK